MVGLPVIELRDNTCHSTAEETDLEPSNILPKAHELVTDNSKAEPLSTRYQI